MPPIFLHLLFTAICYNNTDTFCVRGTTFFFFKEKSNFPVHLIFKYVSSVFIQNVFNKLRSLLIGFKSETVLSN